MTDEQQERLKQIRERWSVKTSNTKSWGEWPTLQSVGGIHGAMNDIDFLLSLVDSQVAEDNSGEIAAIRARAYNSIQFSADTYMFDVRRLLHLYPQWRDATATSMRSRCIEKVKEVRDGYKGSLNQSYDYGFFDGLDSVEIALESVTIQEQEKQR